MARCQGVPKFTIRRATYWSINSNQSQSAGAGWELWCLGWLILDIRLRCQGNPKKRGSIQCDHRRFLHGWRIGRTRGREISSELSNRVRHPVGCNRRSRDRYTADDGRKHSIRYADTAFSTTACSIGTITIANGGLNLALFASYHGYNTPLLQHLMHWGMVMGSPTSSAG